MRVMILVKASTESESGQMPDEKLLAEMGKFNDALVKAGILLAGEGLHPTSRGKRMSYSGRRRNVVDGPFQVDPKDLVAGFWIWKVKSVDEAVEWLGRAPFDGGAEVEIRPILEADDFGKELTPELRAQEERQRALVERQRKEGRP